MPRMPRTPYKQSFIQDGAPLAAHSSAERDPLWASSDAPYAMYSAIDARGCAREATKASVSASDD